MKKIYNLEYQETAQTFTDMYQMFYDDRSDYMYKSIITVGGLLALFIKISINFSVLSVMFFIKFFILWAMAYAAGYLLVKHVITGINKNGSIKTGEAMYLSRVEKCGTDLNTKMDFYEDKFTVTFQNEKKEYSYKEVTRMPASDKFYGFVVGGVYGKKKMVGFPADILNPDEKELFEMDIQEKCQNVVNGFKKR